MSPRSRVRRASLASSFVLAACALTAGPAGAAPVTASGPGTADNAAVPQAQRIRTATTTVDPASGAWSAKVTFAAPQSAATAARLGVALGLVGEKLPMHGFSVKTDPDDLLLNYAHTLPPNDPTPIPAAPSTASFDATRTVLTFSTVDPVLVGKAPDVVHVSLAPIDDPGAFSTAHLVLGATAPTPKIASSAARLTVSKGRLLTVPLTPLRTPAAQRIEVFARDGHRVGFRTLAASYAKRRSVQIRVSPTGLKHLSRSYRTGRVAITTSLDNGSKATAKRAARIRRR